MRPRRVVRDGARAWGGNLGVSTAQKAFCDTELCELTKSTEDKHGKLDRANARLEEAAFRTATLTEEVSALLTEVRPQRVAGHGGHATREGDGTVRTPGEGPQGDGSDFLGMLAVTETDLAMGLAELTTG